VTALAAEPASDAAFLAAAEARAQRVSLLLGDRRGSCYEALRLLRETAADVPRLLAVARAGLLARTLIAQHDGWARRLELVRLLHEPVAAADCSSARSAAGRSRPRCGRARPSKCSTACRRHRPVRCGCTCCRAAPAGAPDIRAASVAASPGGPAGQGRRGPRVLRAAATTQTLNPRKVTP